MLTLQQFAQALRGKVVSGGVSFAPKGHRPGDASGRLLLDPGARNGYRIVCLSPRDDPLRVRDDVDACCGLPRFEAGAGRRDERPDPVAERQRQEARRQAEEAQRAETLRRQRLALAIWDAAQDPRGTPVETYLNSRSLDLADDLAGPVLRFHREVPWERGTAPMMVALMRDVLTGEPQAIQRTALTADGRKIDRWMLGPAAGAAIMLDPFEEIAAGLAIGEGAETCMSARQLGLRPCWALGSAGAIATFEPLGGIEALTILAENDAGGTNQRACDEAAARWHAAGRQVDIIVPRGGKDLNDALMAEAAAWA